MHSVDYFFQADLKVVNDAKGGSFYRDHLPLLGILYQCYNNLNNGDQSNNR